MLGIAPPQIERLAPPDACGDALCTWRSGERRFAYVRREEGFSEACALGAIVIARTAAPAEYAERCGLAALLDATDLAQLGGAMIYETEEGLRIERAWPAHIRRTWTVRAADQE
jgi:hypothetical protein